MVSQAFKQNHYFADTGGTTTGGNILNQYAKIDYPGSTTLQPVHDTDGNMTSGPVPGVNGLSPGVPIPANAALTWDAENRLVKAVVNSSTIHYDYDHQSRLISRSVGVSPTSATRYLYDGWNRIAEYETNGTGHTLKRSYLWGMDLSGSMQGAGGVGGLLSMTVHATTSATFYPTYDGNGNVSEYVDENGDEAAHFEYDPFGNLTVDSESKAGEFPYRFSTKPQDLTSGLYYYGYRWYDPVTGKWPSRDPIGEEGGVNLYGFVGNDGVNDFDVLGLTFRLTPKMMSMEEIWKRYRKIGYTGSPEGGMPRPKVLAPPPDHLIESPDKKCAKVENAVDILVDVVMAIPTTNNVPFVSEVYTDNALIDIARHEGNRARVYRMGYESYIKPIAQQGEIATKCGWVYRESPGEAKRLLQKYLFENRDVGIDAFNEYTLAEQLRIGADSAQSNWIMKGRSRDKMKKLIVPNPPQRPRWKPCP